MRRVLVLLFVLAIIPYGHASIGKGVFVSVDDNQFFDAFNKDILAGGACNVGLQNWENVQYNGFWPVISQCTDPAGTPYSYESTRRNLQIETASGTPSATSKAVLSHFYEYCVNDFDDSPEDCEEVREKFYFKSVPKSAFNPVTTGNVVTPNGSQPGFAIIHFGWCGQDLTIQYTKSTAAPTSADFRFDSEEYCARRPNDIARNGGAGLIANVGMYSKFASSYTHVSPYPVYGYFGTTVNTQEHYTFPLQQACANYVIDITETAQSDWKKEKRFLVPVQGGFQYKQVQSSNTLQVDVMTNANGFATGVKIIGIDGSPGAGGVTFSLYCVAPQDPDADKRYCPTPWSWSDPVNASAPGYACCGDDVDDTSSTKAWQAPGFTCASTPNGPFTWTSDAARCGVGNNWEPTAGCCNPATANTIYDGTMQLACTNRSTVTTPLYKWELANSTNNIITIKNGTGNNVLLVSDGAKFHTCNQDATIPLISTTGGPTVTLTKQLACVVINNTVSGSGKPWICLENWSGYDSTAQYTFDAQKKYVNVSAYQPPLLATKKASVTHICTNGALQPANTKWSPDYTDSGFCNVDQCYFGINPKTTVREACVNKDVWVLDNICLQEGAGPSSVWTSRTQLIADTLYKRAQDLALNNFILHCDSDVRSLNNPAAAQRYSQSTTSAPFINKFCALSNPKASGVQTIASASTLNTASGTQEIGNHPVLRFSSTISKFVEALNHTSITVHQTTCEDALTQDGNFNKCAVPGGNGSIWYNAKYGALVFSTNNNFQLQNNWLDSLKSSWRNLFGSAAPDPLIDLNGEKIYVAKAGSKMVQASLVPTQTGMQATVVYSGLTQQTVDALAAGAGTTASALGSSPNTFIIRLDDPTLQQWNQLTLVVRPS